MTTMAYKVQQECLRGAREIVHAHGSWYIIRLWKNVSSPLISSQAWGRPESSLTGFILGKTGTSNKPAPAAKQPAQSLWLKARVEMLPMTISIWVHLYRITTMTTKQRQESGLSIATLESGAGLQSPFQGAGYWPGDKKLGYAEYCQEVKVGYRGMCSLSWRQK